MACTALTKGRGLDCNRISARELKTYILEFTTKYQSAITVVASGEVTDIEMGSN